MSLNCPDCSKKITGKSVFFASDNDIYICQGCSAKIGWSKEYKNFTLFYICVVSVCWLILSSILVRTGAFVEANLFQDILMLVGVIFLSFHAIPFFPLQRYLKAKQS
ncbi:hypothetical protein BGP75_19985 [Motiliproteus sp. MSK22-1]|nr:hypothetical protein BGP75_19985 [Motiliproteus sp. MSK22-1]